MFTSYSTFFCRVFDSGEKIAHVLFSLSPAKQTLLSVLIEQTGNLEKQTLTYLCSAYATTAKPSLYCGKCLLKEGIPIEERIKLIKRFVELFGKECIEAVVAERQFIGNDWLSFLQAECIPFHIRIKDNMWFTKADGERMRMSWILQGYRAGEVYHHPKILYLDKALVYVSGMKAKYGLRQCSRQLMNIVFPRLSSSTVTEISTLGYNAG